MFGCGRPTTAAARKGLNRLYCRRHEDHFERHGSYVKRSYGAGELRPYRVRAMRWLQANCDDQSVRHAANAIQRLYGSAGALIEAFRLAGKPPAERAKATWAQLRERQVDPLAVLAAWLAIDMRMRDDPQTDRREEFRHVQVAKLVHRMAGGTHKRWEQERPDGLVKVTELHKHPASRGRVLRLVGRAITRACDAVCAAAASS